VRIIEEKPDSCERQEQEASYKKFRMKREIKLNLLMST
jgi:hypothetical protein